MAEKPPPDSVAEHYRIVEALEADRRRTARLLDEHVIGQLNLILAQANAYEQTLGGSPQARMALSVLSSLIKQALQQARDLETHLHPTILQTLGLEPALETLASQEMRARGVQVLLALQRLRERLPTDIELALYRAAQDSVDRAVRQANASQVAIRLERRECDLIFSIEDNGIQPTDDSLRNTQQNIEGMGGDVEIGQSRQGGAKTVIRFVLEEPVHLTDREMEVIRLLAEGQSNKEIAARLPVSPRTVKFHLDNIYSKLGVNTRTEAAVSALRRGWVRQQRD